MTRKAYAWSIDLGHDAIEILPHNPKRIRADIWGDIENAAGIISIGNSGQQALSAANLVLSYFPFTWYGTNPLWAAVGINNAPSQIFTVVELIEE